MKFRLGIALLVLAVVAGVLYRSEHRKPDAENQTSSAAAPAILRLDQAAITKLAITRRGTEPVALSKSGTGHWQITQPKSLDADQEAVSSLLSTLSSLNAESVVEEKAIHLEQYGLAQPAVEVQVTASGNKTQSLLIGDNTPIGGTAYAMLDGDPRVFTTSAVNKTALDKSLSDLRDKRLLTVNFDKVRNIELMKDSQNIEFERAVDNWKIIKPKPFRADQLQINELVSQLRDAKMDITGPGTPDQAAPFAHAKSVVTATVTDEEATQTLQIRKNKDQYYAKSSVVQGAYKIDSTLGQALDKGLDDFRNKQLFDFSYNDPNKVELQSNNTDYIFTRHGRDWWSNGKKLDDDAVESLVDKLRDLTSDKFVSSGFKVAGITVTVTSQDGKKIEKVLIGKSGKDYVAKREDGPDLYQLEQSAVEGIETAAAAIKPAAESAQSKPSAANPDK